MKPGKSDDNAPNLLALVETNTDSGAPSTTSATGAVDIGLDVARWLALDDKIDLRDVESTGKVRERQSGERGRVGDGRGKTGTSGPCTTNV